LILLLIANESEMVIVVRQATIIPGMGPAIKVTAQVKTVSGNSGSLRIKTRNMLRT
jgi:hypothetical protein